MSCFRWFTLGLLLVALIATSTFAQSPGGARTPTLAPTRVDARPGIDSQIAASSPYAPAGAVASRPATPNADPVSSPEQITSSRRLQAETRGDELTAAIAQLLLNPEFVARLSAVPMGQGAVPADLADRAFDRYVDLRVLGGAWAKFDAAQLTDAAMQLAEGERILMRPHKVLSAADALALAAKTAVEAQDKTTLERLQKIADVRKDQALASHLAAGAKLSSASRDDQPGLRVTMDDTSPSHFAILRACSRDLKRARLAGDARTLQVLQQVIPYLPLVSEEQRAHLLAVAKQPVPENESKALDLHKALHQLAVASRCESAGCVGGITAPDYLRGDSRCEGPGCAGGIVAPDALRGDSRCDSPACAGGRFLEIQQALSDMDRLQTISSQDRAAAASALEKLNAASRSCDLASGTGCPL